MKIEDDLTGKTFDEFVEEYHPNCIGCVSNQLAQLLFDEAEQEFYLDAACSSMHINNEGKCPCTSCLVKPVCDFYCEKSLKFHRQP